MSAQQPCAGNRGRSAALEPVEPPVLQAAALLFGPSVVSRLSAIGEHSLDAGWPEEAALIAAAGADRQAAFLTGRACARLALAAAGAPAGPILRSGRMPNWPAGFVGSISHGAGLAWAAVAPRAAVASLGLDVERAAPLPGKVLSRVANTVERRQTAALESTVGDAAGAVLWAAKEAVFKCLSQLDPGGSPPWPEVGLTAESPTHGRFGLGCASDAGHGPVRGAWLLGGGRVFAACGAGAEGGPA